MPIYQRALSPQRMLREQSTGLLGMGQPAQLPERPLIPQVGVGNVDFIGGRAAERQQGINQQQQVMGSLLQLGQLGVSGYGAYSQGAFDGGALGGRRANAGDFGSRSFSTDPGYVLSYQGY